MESSCAKGTRLALLPGCAAFALMAASAPSQAGGQGTEAAGFRHKEMHRFEVDQGYCPMGTMTLLPDGFLYGTTQTGGPFPGLPGVVYKMGPHGDFTVLHYFTNDDGNYPAGGLTPGSDGNLYGTTFGGGIGMSGTIFRVTPTGEFTTLHSFDDMSGGQAPFAAPVEGSDGNFYGTTFVGGINMQGTIYRMSPAGEVTILHSFLGGASDGFWPRDFRLLAANDGNLYGTTTNGGTADMGVIFRLNMDGTYQVIHSFVGLEGQPDMGALMQAKDGHIYGTNSRGGEFGYGTAYRISTNGKFELLHPFRSREGYTPLGGLTQAKDGNFYGVTAAGGERNGGTVYRMSPDGHVKVIYDIYRRASGLTPQTGLTPGKHGDYYGSTCNGGWGWGDIFRMRPNDAMPR
jgi:uncharacterized repeat protein (TIGR03803 family)